MTDKIEQTKWFMLCESTTEEEELERQKSYHDYNKKICANIKFDGERIMAIKKDGDIILLNRRGNIVNSNFREVVEELKTLNDKDFIIDGEIISTNDDFTALQRRALTKNPTKLKQLQAEIPVVYMVFDIISYDNTDYTYYGTGDYKTLRERLAIMTSLFKDKTLNFIKLAEFKPVFEMLAQARAEDREGIIVKEYNGHYCKGRRCSEYQKLKFFEEAILKVIRYTENPKGIRAEDEQLNAV